MSFLLSGAPGRTARPVFHLGFRLHGRRYQGTDRQDRILPPPLQNDVRLRQPSGKRPDFKHPYEKAESGDGGGV